MDKPDTSGLRYIAISKMHSAVGRKRENKQKLQNSAQGTNLHKDKFARNVFPEEMVFKWDRGMWDFEPRLLPEGCWGRGDLPKSH